MVRIFVTSWCFPRSILTFAEQYLQDPMQLEHACDLLLASELFAFHSERMCDLLLEDAQTVRR